MNETAPDRVSPRDLPVPEQTLAITPSLPPPAPQVTVRRPRFLRAVIALPLVILRNPVRSLAVTALLLLIGTAFGIVGMWLWASYHLRLGRDEMERYHSGKAVPHLQAVLSVWPHDRETLLLAARAARRTDAFDTASRLLDDCAEHGLEDENVQLERVCLRAARGEPESVTKYCHTLIEQNHPASSLLYEALASGYLRVFQPFQAEGLVNVWLQQEPNNPQAHFLQGKALEMRMRNSEAIQSFRSALQLDPLLDDARVRMCSLLLQMGSHDEARTHLEYLRTVLPNHLMVLVYLARVKVREGDSEEAKRILDDVLARSPTFAAALVQRGVLAMRDGQTAQAEKWLRQAIEEEPSDFQARDQLALCLERSGKLEEADKEREQLKQMEQDIRDIQAISTGQMERDPHNPDSHYKVGMIAMRSGNPEEALRWLHSALKEDPDHQPSHKALMEFYQRIGDLGRAREHRRQLTAENGATR